MVSLEQDTLLTANLEELVKKKGLGKDKGQTGEQNGQSGARHTTDR